MRISYPGFEGQQNLGQEEDKALQADGEVFEDKVSYAHSPDQIEEIKAVEVGFGEYEAGRDKTSRCCGCFTIDGVEFSVGMGRLRRNQPDKCKT